MKRSGLLLLAAGLCLAADDAKDAAKAEMKKLEGTWVATSIEYDGEQVLGGEVKDVKLVISGDEISVKGAIPDADKYAKLTYKVDPSTTPKIIDVTFTVGADKGTVMEGIYKLEGDELRLCVQVFGKERPGEFATQGGSNRALGVLKREKP
jgi:uncharacterized protein (TIGR03067 family)